MKLKCYECENFAYWDGDYCCCAKMEILSECDDNEEPLNKENLIEEKDCSEGKKSTSKHVEDYKKMFEMRTREEIEEEMKELREKAQALRDELNTIEYGELPNFEGKLIYRYGYGYMFVTYQSFDVNSPLYKGGPAVWLQGAMFNNYWGEHSDISYIDFNCSEGWHMTLEEFNRLLKAKDIKEVTKEEFDSNLAYTIEVVSEKVKDRFNDIIERYKK